MPYSLGTSTAALSGHGAIAVADLVGVRVSVTAIPNGAGSRAGTPLDYFGLGHLTPGDFNGWDSNLVVQHTSQLFYPLRDGITTLGYSFVPGVTATLQLLTGQGMAGRAQPWDRNAALWGANPSYTSAPTSGESVPWSYTVPVGRKLCLQHASVRAMLTGDPSAPSYLFTIVAIGGISTVYAYSNLARRYERYESTSGAEIHVPAGISLQLLCGNYNGGTSAVHLAQLFGYLFDA